MSSNHSIIVQENVPLAPLTTLKVGGPARFLVNVRNDAEAAGALDLARSRGLELFVLGGGSNILVSDEGFDGLVMQITSKGVTVQPDVAGSERVTVTAQAGEDWDGFVSFCVERGLSGLECLSGIPGTVGGTPVQNVGAYGQEVSETIVSVRCLDRTTGAFVELSSEDCGFSYRSSIFNSTMRDRYIVLSVTFSLKQGGSPKIAYKDLIDHFGGQIPSLAEVRQAVIRIRAAKSMVIDPSDPNSRSAGSFFKNPVVPRSKLEEIARPTGGNVPHFDAGEGNVKIPAAWLIEQAGFHKGYVQGNVGISSNHSLAIVNRGSATANDIVKLQSSIISAVSARFGINLMPEPIFVGFRKFGSNH